ncbi:MAG: hypothetical protein NT123_22235 [Proteobacteria bacterium]|nr:hypothetical protein [Pseudomonadota bacterium]
MKIGHVVMAFFFSFLALPASAADLCAGRQPGAITFYNAEVDRNKAPPTPVTQLSFGKPMYAVLCLTDAVGPQPPDGRAFRVILWIDGKQSAVYRPELSKSRKDIIVDIKGDFGDRIFRRMKAGTYELHFHGATEKVSEAVSATLDFKKEADYFQRLKVLGYVADGEVTLVK